MKRRLRKEQKMEDKECKVFEEGFGLSQKTYPFARRDRWEK